MTIVAKTTPTTVPDVTETYARSLTDNTALFIDNSGSWKVGKFGQTISEYKNITFGTTQNINDLTYDVTALVASQGAAGGYRVYASANQDEGVIFEINVDANGVAQNYKRLTNKEIWDAEGRLNKDLNGNGGIGSGNVLINDSSDNVFADANGDLFVQSVDGRLIVLTVDGQLLNIRDVGDLEFADVSIEADGSLSAYLYSDDGDLYYQAFNAAGQATGDLELISEFETSAQAATVGKGVLAASAEGRAQVLNAAGQSAEQKTGVDLNRQSDTVPTAGWTEMLKTPSLRAAVEKATADGATFDHSGVVNLVNLAIAEVGQTNKVSQAVIDDLRAIAARGKALFGAKDTGGSATGYLAYVFDKVVNDSDANAFFTGGTAAKQALGNLSSDSTGAQLGLLRDKWLLGKDTPNPNTQGDTANSTAKAATGVYKSFEAPLFTDGPQFQDVNQGSAGTCYLLASIANFALIYPKTLASTFVSNSVLEGAGRTFGVRFFDLNGGVHWVTVNDQLVVSSAQASDASYTKALGVDAAGKSVPELWAPLIEKAYAQFNELKLNKRENSENAFYAIEGGGAELAAFLLNHTGVQYSADNEASSVNGVTRVQIVKPAEGKSVLDAYIEAVNSGLTVWVGANNDIKDGNTILIKGGHAHMAFDADSTSKTNSTVTIYNPWGSSPGGGDPDFKSPFLFDLAKLVGVPGLDLYVDIAPAKAGS